jgi:hypothetical protein
MTRLHAFASQAPAHSSLLVTLVAEGQAFVRSQPRAPLCSPTATDYTPSPCLPLAFVRLLLHLLTRALTGSVTIGRPCQTR